MREMSEAERMESLKDIGKTPLKELIPASTGSDLARLERVMDRVTRMESEKHDRPKNQFIRLIHNDSLFLCSSEQTGVFLHRFTDEDKQSQWRRQDVDRAARHKLVLLERELYVLEAVLLSTVHAFGADGFFDEQAMSMEESSIHAEHTETEQMVRALEAAAAEAETSRLEEPLIDEYAAKLLRFLRAKSEKRDRDAADLMTFLRSERDAMLDVWTDFSEAILRVDEGRRNLLSRRMDIWSKLRTLVKGRMDEQPNAITDREGNDVLQYRLALHSYQMLACKQALLSLTQRQQAFAAIELPLEEQLQMLVEALSDR